MQTGPAHSQNKSRSITFRLPVTTADVLDEIAIQNGTSINTLVSNILKQHIEWHANAAKAGFISVKRGLVLQLMERFSEEELGKIGENLARDEAKDFIIFLRNKFDIDTALEVIETWIAISGYPYRHHHHDSKHSFVIQHDMGMKWSFYYGFLFRQIFADFGIHAVTIDKTENTLCLEVDL